MSLLLDALKSADSTTAAPEEEPLDAQATLELLAQRPTAQSRLALLPILDVAVAPPSELAPELIAVDAPVGAAEPSAERAPSLTLAGGTEDIASVPPAAMAAMAQSNTRTAAGAAPAKSPAKKYGLLLAVLAAFVGIGMIGYSLWPFGSSAIIEVRRRQPEPAPASTAAASAPSTEGVQVSSARPVGQFAYAGDAPEIDLRDAEIRPAETSATTPAITPPPPTAASRPPVGRVEHAARTRGMSPSSAAPSAGIYSAAPTLSVTRTEAPSSIDRHVAAGYRALAAGDAAIAQNEYVAALELDPNNVDAILGMATIAARDGRSKAAAAAYARVLQLEPGNPDATAAMAMLDSSGSAADSNESRLKILIASDDGGRPALHAALGGVYAADARWTEAAQEYFVALGKDPGNPVLAFNVAACLDHNHTPAVALNFYRQSLEFARQRPTQIDLNAIEQRINQLQARAEAQALAVVQAHGAPGAP